ncbi:CHRD domain-containing protein [Leptolyngbya sp. KIOST-1]|uniref:CHRD domain-containing protein n=1 Tax=Leptolyngbya sp. KIOST-1 TaxID=1229172 RepID=UPI001CECA6A4|nr:CHRD domain-containing protein [Leptolyngbya sp. KIOST-1]
MVLFLYSPLVSRGVAQSPLGAPRATLAAPAEASFAVGQQLDANLAAATAPLLAQGPSSGSIVTYIAMLSSQNVVPNAPMTEARGVVGAALAGDRLVVRGSFRELSSALRDYATDPVDPPNPNITSAFHIHRGSPSENGPFQYALEVTMNSTGRGGSATGDYRLTPEQIQALQNGLLYVDLHTTRNRGGELRGILMPA